MLEKLISILKLLVPFDFVSGVSGEERRYSVREYEGEDTWVAAASYIPFVCAAILLLRKDNSEFVSDHAKQALVLVILALLVFMLIPSPIRLIISAILILLLVVSVYRALQGRKYYIPGVSELSRLIEI